MNPPNHLLLISITQSMQLVMKEMNLEDIENFHKLISTLIELEINEKSLTKSEKPILSVVKSEE